jgi:hypothetical protein
MVGSMANRNGAEPSRGSTFPYRSSSWYKGPVTTLAGEPVPATGPEAAMAAVAETFLAALAVQDFPRVASVFRDDVHLRALLPGGLHEADGAAKLERTFARWFGDTEAFEVLDTEVGVIGPRLCLRWRVRLQAERLGPGWWVVEQEAYGDLEDDRLSELSLLCSGYLAEPVDG